MRFYSIIIAAFALNVSTAFAKGPDHLGEGECFKWCKKQRSICPPESPPKQLSDGCWTCCRDMSYQWPE
ncbi:uncharacterized protein BDW47DRAFT_98643 [Aspergillus candidus]|uniref:Uncharacterized protein n=1 Tax=Aspergillus candidus TaxID=41067 RepID=A0A2I2FMJ0_ASPCN|nr:hypothetical protein BDW47DRAFT_98643 [Aspergillus candidus]PLB41833.1 hypothetical protein BDW47DRAFT_98643 [Aspergillus candidus]